VKKAKWIQSVLQALAGLSRTLGGVSDTSSAAEKPKLEVEEGGSLADRTRENLEQALEFLWKSRERQFASPAEVREFVDRVASLVSEDLLQPGQSLYRTWETKFRQTAPEAIEQEYQNFCAWLLEALEGGDPVETAALVEKRLDSEIHPFADGCGRTAKVLAMFVLLRNGLEAPVYGSREEYYATVTKSDAEWCKYYRTRQLAGQLLGLVPAKDREAVTRTAELVLKRHEGQLRKGGEPHTNHVLRVGIAAAEYALAHGFEPERFRILVLSAILHDTLEDTPTSDEELIAQFGSEIARIVRAVSHVEEEEPEEVYLSRVAEGGELAVLVKFFDRMDNFACLKDAPLKFRQKVIRLQTKALPIWQRICPGGAPQIEAELDRLRQEVR
jgi:hypothetical protein